MLTDEILIKKEPLMKMFGSGGGIVIGIALVVFGYIVQSRLFEWVLDIVGWSIIIMGIIAIISGGVSLFSGKRGRAGNF